ncbi:MAG: hypothetical protein JWN22_2664 [Nocardioides sp.]|nr:hypothetical protein [Nocardioides sp.]
MAQQSVHRWRPFAGRSDHCVTVPDDRSHVAAQKSLWPVADHLVTVGRRQPVSRPVEGEHDGRWVGLGSNACSTSRRRQVDRIRELEDLRAAAAAAQVLRTADLDASQRRAQIDAGVPARRLGEGIASQVAVARRESPVRGAQHLGLSKVLTTEMPDTLSAMTQGRLSEWRATLLVRETARSVTIRPAPRHHVLGHRPAARHRGRRGPRRWTEHRQLRAPAFRRR